MNVLLISYVTLGTQNVLVYEKGIVAPPGLGFVLSIKPSGKELSPMPGVDPDSLVLLLLLGVTCFCAKGSF
jgi:hypothetical protein